MPGPPPEHPHLRLLKGNPGKRSVRSPPEPARADECPPPPKHLNGCAQEVWLELAPELHKPNLLTILDIGPLCAYCCAYAHWQEAEEALQRSRELTIKTAKGHPRVNPLVRIASQAMADMQRIGAQFGLSPNARLRLCGIEPPPAPSRFVAEVKRRPRRAAIVSFDVAHAKPVRSERGAHGYVFFLPPSNRE